MKKVEQNVINNILADYTNHKSVSEIAKDYSLSINTVLHYLTINRYREKRVTYSNNDTYFDTIDSPEKAYILGFLIADGCIKLEKRKNGNFSKRVSFSNSIDDEEVIKYIHNTICPQVKLVYTHNTKGVINRKPQITLQWTSPHMVDVLINKYHILPNKTLDVNFTFPFETIPTKFINSFILGFFDGDGYIGKNRIQFVGTSKPFLLQLEEIFIQLFKANEDLVTPYRGHIIEERNKMIYYKYRIATGKGRLRLIKKFLYSNCSIFLRRKYNKFNI